MTATEQYFHVVLFIMLYKVILTFESLDEILQFPFKCVVQEGMWALTWMLLNRAFIWIMFAVQHFWSEIWTFPDFDHVFHY